MLPQMQPEALTHDVESETNESMVRCQRQQHFIHQQDMLEVIDHALSVKKVHGCGEEIPVQRLGEAEILLLTGHIGDSDNFLEGNDLNGSHDSDDIDMA